VELFSVMRMNRKKQNSRSYGTLFITLVFCIPVLIQSGCVKEYSNQPLANQVPQTFFWIFSDTAVAEGISKQELRWWGEDQDGYIVGYLLSLTPDLSTLPVPDTLTYSFVTTMDSIISFPLRKARQTFLVSVHAIDNTLKYSIPIGASIKLNPFIYWDKDKSGNYNGGDVQLPDLVSSIDLAGAKQQFPIVNTPPTMSYVLDDADNSVNAFPSPTTYTVAGFAWKGHDFDGDETIFTYRLSLNDSTFTQPMVIHSSITVITLSVPRGRSDSSLTGIVYADVLIGRSPNARKIGSLSGLKLDANNVLYIQAIDIAGDNSKFLPFPSAGQTWYVKKPTGKMLIVVDYAATDRVPVRQYYIDSVFSRTGVPYDILDIRTGATATRYGALVPAKQNLNPVLIYTFRLYQCVYWYTDGTPSLDIARNTLYNYWSMEGGHLIFSSYFVNPGDIPDAGHAYRDIAPIDSLGSSSLVPTRFSGTLNPDSSLALDIYPLLGFRGLATGLCIFPMYRNAAARDIYFLPNSIDYPRTSAGVIDESNRVIFFNLPLHKLYSVDPKDKFGNSQGVVAFFQKAFQAFGIQ